MCAVCSKTVDSLTVWREDYSFRLRFRAHCHGAEEECFLSELALYEAHSLDPGLAFQTNESALPAPVFRMMLPSAGAA